ncbi:MAG: hypothetical protein JWO94_3613, partial [Verrucomicrobiaceae bacterium]|nr:hypothetical protein [Verrucomicrobiaceae bacterium]
RKHPVSRMLRDDFVALNVASVAYGMLYTSALAYQEEEVAAIALSHLNALPSQLTELGRLIPEAVVKELTEEYPQANISAIDTARKAIDAAWMDASMA